MSDVYFVVHVLSIDSDESGMLLFQQPLHWCNSEHDILHQIDADAFHRIYHLKNSQGHFHNYHRHNTIYIVRFEYIQICEKLTVGPTTIPSSTTIVTSALASIDTCIALGGCVG
jgi:hypothetical protein